MEMYIGYLILLGVAILPAITVLIMFAFLCAKLPNPFPFIVGIAGSTLILIPLYLFYLEKLSPFLNTLKFSKF